MSYRSIHGIMHQAQELAQAVDAISTQPNLSGKFKKYLHKYYMVEMTGTDLLAFLLRHNEDVITHQGVVYNPVYSGTSWQKAVDAKQVVLSFRQTKHILNCPNYVVVTIKE